MRRGRGKGWSRAPASSLLSPTSLASMEREGQGVFMPVEKERKVPLDGCLPLCLSEGGWTKRGKGGKEPRTKGRRTMKQASRIISGCPTKGKVRKENTQGGKKEEEEKEVVFPSSVRADEEEGMRKEREKVRATCLP